MNQIPDGPERELAPRDGRRCRMQARRDDRNPQHGAATIIDMGVSVSMPQATHRNQRKAPSVEWMGRIRDRDLFGPSILRPNRGIKKWDRKFLGSPRARYRAGRRSRAAGASRSTSEQGGTSPRRARRRHGPVRPQPRGAGSPGVPGLMPPSAPGPRRSPECVTAATPRLSRDRPGRIASGPTPGDARPAGVSIAECRRPPGDHDARGGSCRGVQRSAGSWATSLDPVR